MDNQHKIDALFKKAQLTPTAIPFAESKRCFVQSVEAGATTVSGKRSFFNLKNILIMIGTIGILGIFFTLSFSHKEIPELTKQHPEKQVESSIQKQSTPSSESVSTETSKNRENPAFEIWTNLIPTLPVEEVYFKKDRSLKKGSYPLIMQHQPFTELDDHIPFPKLTEEEIAANHKQKKKMIKALSKFDSKQYVYIPSSSYSYKGVTASVQAFYMQRTEVTNLEYRTFLFDLLIQGRKQEFLLAAPDQTLWTRMLDDSLISFQTDYFSDPTYDDFPVVNISKKGAEMYCAWITTETNKTRDSDFINDVRIPEILEWSLAASNLGKTTKYPWAGDKLAKDDEFNANFNLNRYNGTLPSVRQKTKTENPRTTSEFVTGQLIAPADEYEPNDLGLYNMSGNVSEMVSLRLLPETAEAKVPNEDQIVTCGGSWISSPEELEVFNETLSHHVDGHPSIGFRVVVTYLRRTN